MIKRNLFIIMIFTIVCSLLTSCGSIEDAYNNINEEISEKKNSISNDSESLENQKYTAYISLNNFITRNLEKSLDYYFDKFGDTEEIKVDKNSNLQNGILLQLNKKELEENLKYASKNPSLDKIDKCVKELDPKLKELIDLIDEADSYYKLKSYMDDDFVKGKSLHKKICLQYNEVKPLAKKFSSEFESAFLKKSNKDLENFKKNDYMIRYYALSVILRAKDLETELNDQGITCENVSDLDVDKFKEKYNLLVEDTNKFLDYSKDAERIKKEKLDPNFEYANVFKYRITDVKAAATDILIRSQKENKNNISKDGTPENYTDTIKDAVSEYIKIE
ncbi:YiiG family protein [Tepidibacter hydrothermalis]|uniref:YiiG family protein n=1 Tax=Tepidibacter hydrothermalis TaxID=3036126 RepID=A0ABY8EDB6_9FIRM|nr:YiiG family protein [Tepidibacter hydrothermalis]WFD10928.1 YiiG family protein [Tepidibacter hydrothermalis]